MVDLRFLAALLFRCALPHVSNLNHGVEALDSVQASLHSIAAATTNVDVTFARHHFASRTTPRVNELWFSKKGSSYMGSSNPSPPPSLSKSLLTDSRLPF